MSTKARTQTSLFILLCALSLFICWTPLLATFRLALADDAYTHILLILPLSALLIFSDTRRCDSRTLPFTDRPSLGFGVSLLVLSSAVICGARWILTDTPDRVSLGTLGLVIWWIGSVILCFGIETFKSFLFPLCFLFLLVPLPPSALSRIVEFLQHQSAVAARIIFQLARVPVTQDGIMLSIPGLDIEVAQECSSIRSSTILIVTTMVLAFLLLRSWWKRALLIAMAIPLSIIKNGFRIFVIAELGTHVDPGFLTGRLHRQGGIIFFVLSLVLITVLLFALRRTEFSVPAAMRNSR